MLQNYVFDISEELQGNAYPGRGIILGRTPDNKKNVIAYFIMGRSENSRNRVFVETEDGIRTEAFDPSKMVDPSLIIYHPVRGWGARPSSPTATRPTPSATIWQRARAILRVLRTRQFRAGRAELHLAHLGGRQ